MDLSVKSKYQLLKKVDTLPTGPEWHCDIIRIRGDCVGPNGEFLTEEEELWRRDVVECIADLLGNPAFREFIAYEPVKIMRDGKRHYGEMNTGDWWWEVQVRTL